MSGGYFSCRSSTQRDVGETFVWTDGSAKNGSVCSATRLPGQQRDECFGRNWQKIAAFSGCTTSDAGLSDQSILKMPARYFTTILVKTSQHCTGCQSINKAKIKIISQSPQSPLFSVVNLGKSFFLIKFRKSKPFNGLIGPQCLWHSLPKRVVSGRGDRICDPVARELEG